MPLSQLAAEKAAHHYTVRASITPEQWSVINREALCDRASTLNGKSPRDNLYAILEREARDGR